MEKAGFDAASWSHWLLIICFVGVVGLGMYALLAVEQNIQNPA